MIPNGTRFIGISESVDLTERKSEFSNSQTEPYTIEDIINSVPTGAAGFHMPLPQVVAAGLKYSVALTGTAPVSTAYGANFMSLSPFIPANDITISNISIQVTTGVASALAKILVYADVNGRPNGLLIESVDIDCSTLGPKIYTVAYTFKAGETYWIGTILNSTQTMRSITAANSISIGNNITASTIYNILFGIYTYTDPVPTNPTGVAPSSGNTPMVMLQ